MHPLVHLTELIPNMFRTTLCTFKSLEQKRTTHLNHLLDIITETKTIARQFFEDFMDLMQKAYFDLVLSQ